MRASASCVVRGEKARSANPASACCGLSAFLSYCGGGEACTRADFSFCVVVNSRDAFETDYSRKPSFFLNCVVNAGLKTQNRRKNIPTV